LLTSVAEGIEGGWGSLLLKISLIFLPNRLEHHAERSVVFQLRYA
jgi:hypothetical protein